MAILVHCEHCGARFHAKEDCAGWITKCGSCGSPLAIPSISRVCFGSPITAEIVGANDQHLMRFLGIAMLVGFAGLVIYAGTVLFPWSAATFGLFLLISGFAYVVLPSVRVRLVPLPLRFARSPYFAVKVVAGYIALGTLLIGLSQSRIRAQWRLSRERALVTEQIASAQRALDEGRTQDALQVSQSRSKATNEQRALIDTICSRAAATEHGARVKEANAKVAEAVFRGSQRLMLNDLGAAEIELRKAVALTQATEVAKLKELANRIANERVTLAAELASKGLLEEARREVEKATAVPGATDLTAARRLSVSVSDRHAELLVGIARAQLDDGNVKAAEATIKMATAYQNSISHAEAQKLLNEINSIRAKASEDQANKNAAQMIAEAALLIATKRFDEAERKLTSVQSEFPDATDVQRALERLTQSRKAEQDRIRRLANEEREARDRESHKIEAWVFAQLYITQCLKSPSTASFGSLFRGDYQDPLKCVSPIGGNKYQVKGWVDAQNAFGATVRTDFVLELEREGKAFSVVRQPIMIQR